jgi:hypothetical protein
MPPLTVSAVLSDAGDVYQLLFRRSFPIALGVYAVMSVSPSVAAATADFWIWSWAIWIVLSALAVPFQAYALSVLYYRLVDPHRPAIDPHVRTWPSVWSGPPEFA